MGAGAGGTAIDYGSQIPTDITSLENFLIRAVEPGTATELEVDEDRETMSVIFSLSSRSFAP